jgi:multidrug efflux pump subunit AcrA (membrane-fusion protein)
MTDKQSLSIEVGRILLPVAILAVGVGGFFALGSRPKLPLEKANESLAPVVEAVPVALHQGVLDIDVDGVVVPYREVSLAAEVSGRISLKADVCRAGNYVTKGTTLLEIDPRDYELKSRQLTKQLNQADVELKELDVEAANTKSLIELAEDTLKLRENEHKRFSELAKKDYATDSQMDEQQRNVLTARNGLLKLIQNTPF